MYLLLFVAALGSALLIEALGPGFAANVVTTSWILAPYLVLTAAVVFAEKRVSLLATAIATVLGAVGALSPVVIAAIVGSDVAARLAPIYQAGAVAVLLPTCRRIMTHLEEKPRAER